MATVYPNQYYEELASLIISNPSLELKKGEVCFYQGDAESFQKTAKTINGKPKTKTSFILTPWLVGIHRKKQVEVTEEVRTDYYKGRLYITNMRIVFQCRVDGFDLMIPSITKVSRYNNGIKVFSKGKSYNVMTSELEQVLHVFDLINKAQE